MKLAIMQPYFMPYIGYWQLINAVDKFVVYDDVNFIKGGWINRNRIILNGKSGMINIPMEGASSFKKINEIKLGKRKEKLLLTIEQSYKKAPFLKDVMPVFNEIIKYDECNLALFLTNSIVKISDYLKIDAEFIISSNRNKDNNLKGQEKVLEICKTLGCETYINAIGGEELYDKEIFKQNGIDLKFIKTNEIVYNQNSSNFISNLSIIDVMMFNSPKKINEMLNDYELL